MEQPPSPKKKASLDAAAQRPAETWANFLAEDAQRLSLLLDGLKPPPLPPGRWEGLFSADMGGGLSLLRGGLKRPPLSPGVARRLARAQELLDGADANAELRDAAMADLREMADAGVAEAQKAYGHQLMGGHGLHDKAAGLDYLAKARVQGLRTHAMLRDPALDAAAARLIQQHREAKASPEAMRALTELEALASAGSARAAFHAGLIHRQRLQQDALARHFLQIAADLEHLPALIELQFGRDKPVGAHPDIPPPQGYARPLSSELRTTLQNETLVAAILHLLCETRPEFKFALALRYWKGVGVGALPDRARQLAREYLDATVTSSIGQQQAARKAGWDSHSHMEAERRLRLHGEPAQAPQASARHVLGEPAIVVGWALHQLNNLPVCDFGPGLARQVIALGLRNMSGAVREAMPAALASTALALSKEKWLALYDILLSGQSHARYVYHEQGNVNSSVTSGSWRRQRQYIFHESHFLEIEDTSSTTHYVQTFGMQLRPDHLHDRRVYGGDYACVLVDGKQMVMLAFDTDPPVHKELPLQDFVRTGRPQPGLAEWNNHIGDKLRH